MDISPLDEVSPVEVIAARPLLESFLEGQGAATRKAYLSDLAAFASYLHVADARTAADHLLASGHGPANATALAWRAQMVADGLKPSTINRRLAALRSLATLAKALDRIGWELDVRNVKSQAYRNTNCAGPARSALDDVLAAWEARGDGKRLRDIALLRLLHDLGLRRQEAIDLDLADVDLERETVAIVGKGRAEPELLTLPPETAAAIRAWLAARGAEAGPLFTNFDRAKQGDGRLTGRAVHKICTSHGFRPHGLRHLAITEALDLTAGDVRGVQRFSRHRDLKTVLIYDDNRQDFAGRIAEKVARGDQSGKV
jgi:integrase/recombinase XerC